MFNNCFSFPGEVTYGQQNRQLFANGYDNSDIMKTEISDVQHVSFLSRVITEGNFKIGEN